MARQGKSRQEVGILGKKIGMTQVFDENGAVQPVTVVEAGPCKVVQIKTVANDGYNAVQIAFGKRNAKRLTKPMKGHLKKGGVENAVRLLELRQSPESIKEFTVGQEIVAAIFAPGDLVDAIGTSIGKGFQGVMKRHNMKGAAKATHGTHEYFRHGGSLGCRFPQHVFKGKKMAGHLGDAMTTNLNLKVIQVKPEQNLLLIRGSIPGKRHCVVLIRKAIRAEI